METTINKLQALQNAANNIGLTIHEKLTQDKRKTVKTYFANVGNETVSPNLDYENMNHFLLGWIRANKFKTKAEKAAPDLLADAISDVECIEDFVRRFKNEETDKVVYFLENLLVSKKAVINKAIN